MSKASRFLVAFLGLLSPFAALFFYSFVYVTLTRASTNHEKDWLFRLSISTLAMTVPFFITLGFALREWRRRALTLTGKIGLGIAILSLGLTAKPVHDGILRWKQTKNQAMRGVTAPAFNTTDLNGNVQRLADHRGEVVLVNIWATWCVPCRKEMPKLDLLYREKKSQGFIVFGISNEDPSLQQRFVKEVPVSYPLLTLRGDVPALYRDIARYPALFLIDREGRLQPAPPPEQPFEKVQETVEALLKD